VRVKLIYVAKAEINLLTYLQWLAFEEKHLVLITSYSH